MHTPPAFRQQAQLLLCGYFAVSHGNFRVVSDQFFFANSIATSSSNLRFTVGDGPHFSSARVSPNCALHWILSLTFLWKGEDVKGFLKEEIRHGCLLGLIRQTFLTRLLCPLPSLIIGYDVFAVMGTVVGNVFVVAVTSFAWVFSFRALF